MFKEARKKQVDLHSISLGLDTVPQCFHICIKQRCTTTAKLTSTIAEISHELLKFMTERTVATSTFYMEPPIKL